MNEPEPSSSRPREEREPHTRIVKCTLAAEESRAYWARVTPGRSVPTKEAFEGYWFGARSLSWVKEILAAMRTRFDAFPESLAVLSRWSDTSPETRALICHWHVQLSDPIYRTFTGEFLVARRDALRAEVHRTSVLGWLGDAAPARWTLATRKQVATKLLTTAGSAGLLLGRRDPRPLAYPRVPDEALGYLMHALRGVSFAGSFTVNPYLASVGLVGPPLEARLRALPSLSYRRMADIEELGWRYEGVRQWAEAELFAREGAA